MNYRVLEHNREVRQTAEYRAKEMKLWPSPLEDRMKEFLDDNWIHYEEQKIFYIKADDGWVNRYYIADFYIPDKKIIIEVDGKFHDSQKQKDRDRTKEIKEHFPGIEVLRYRWEDFKDAWKMQDLILLIKE